MIFRSFFCGSVFKHYAEPPYPVVCSQSIDMYVNWLSKVFSDWRPKLSTLDRWFCFLFSVALTFPEAIRVVTRFQDFAVVGDSIQQRGGHLSVAKDLNPFAKVEVCRDD